MAKFFVVFAVLAAAVSAGKFLYFLLLKIHKNLNLKFKINKKSSQTLSDEQKNKIISVI